MITALSIVFIVVIILGVPMIRRYVVTGPIFRLARGLLPRITTIERQAIEAGTDGFDRDIFSGRPRWDTLRAMPKCALNTDEQAFYNGPTKKLCELIVDWEIRGVRREVPEYVWDFAKKHGFLGLRVSKEAGGHGFSAQAQSIILGTVASRSLDASTIVEVPNSLGPDELIEEYGTEEQKQKYLKAFVTGDEIACFAITSPMGGSDAANMRDVGYATMGIYKRRKVLGFRISWSKRYITLAPKATVIALAFHAFDPDGLLGGDRDCGITLALIPANHHGVNIGRRHLPSGVAFPNGPTWGEDVFIPLEWVIGAKDGVGQGWKMIMQCLAAGRGISLPSMAAAGTKLMLRVSSAYSVVRRQFNKPIGKIEGIQEPLARLVEAAYVSESGRALTASLVTRETRPLVLSSILKYQLTEYARKAVNDAMDIHGGKAVIDGPSNYLQSTYQIIPVAITVEGANIITRSLIVVGQAVLRSHPYFGAILNTLQGANTVAGLRAFDRLVASHTLHIVRSTARSFFHALTIGYFANGSLGPRTLRRWYQLLARYSASFAILADALILYYRGALKKKQHIGGRISDVLSDVYLLAAVLKRYEDDGCPTEDYSVVELCMRNGLYRIEQTLAETIRNIPSLFLRIFLKTTIFPLGLWRNKAEDRLLRAATSLVLTPGEARDRLTRYIYVPANTNDPVGVLEAAFVKSVELEPLLHTVDQAVRNGQLERYHGRDWLRDAVTRGILTEHQRLQLEELYALTDRAIAVDHFDPKEVHGTVTPHE